LLVLLAALVAPTATDGANFGIGFTATLSGAQEVPTVDTSTRGNLVLFADRAFTRASFSLRVFDGQEVTAAHLHCGRAGQNGPVAFFLYGGPTRDVNGLLAMGTLDNEDYTGNDCTAAIGRPVNNIASLVLAARDGLIYVNVHTEDNPPGETRGQLWEHTGPLFGLNQQHGGDHEDDDDEEDDHSHDALDGDLPMSDPTATPQQLRR
jgi:hypothetical protein